MQISQVRQPHVGNSASSGAKKTTASELSAEDNNVSQHSTQFSPSDNNGESSQSDSIFDQLVKDSEALRHTVLMYSSEPTPEQPPVNLDGLSDTELNTAIDTLSIDDAAAQEGQSDIVETSASHQQEVGAIRPIFLESAKDPGTPTAAELGDAAERAKVRLEAGDRAGAYIELYEVTGSEQLLLQAQITTYSGAVGGMALEGNFRAKHANPDHYNVTLDQFSHQIDAAVVKLAKDSADDGAPENFNTLKIMEADSKVWKNNNVASHFPGNIQFMDIEGKEHILKSPGSENAILAQDEAELGRRPSEYANDPRYSIKTSDDGRFTTVLNNETNRIEVFFDNNFESDLGTPIDGIAPDLEQLKDELPSDRILAERQAKMDFVQAGQHVAWDQLQAFDENKLKPVENLDRVFEYEGKLYQVDDKALMENNGVDFSKLVEGYKLQNKPEGAQYLFGLNHLGHDVDKMIENKDYITDVGRERAFEAMISDGRIVALTDNEVQAHNEMLKSLSEQGLPSPYQSTSDAHKALNNELLFRQ